MRLVLQKVSEKLPIDLMYLRNTFGLKDSDSFLIEVLKLAIGNIEARVGMSIIKKVWKMVHNNCNIYLSNGPIGDIISITDSRGKILNPVTKIRKQDNMLLVFKEVSGFITVIYEAGYDECNLPECLKSNIICEFLKVYDENEKRLSIDNESYKRDFLFDYMYG